MNVIRNIGGSSGGNLPDRKTGKETPKPKTTAEAAKKKKTVVDDAVKKTRTKIDGLGENIDVDA